MFIHYSDHVIDLLDVHVVHVHVAHVRNLLCSKKHDTLDIRKSYRVIRLSWHQQLWWSYWHCSSSCFFQEDTKMRRHLTLLGTDALASHFWYRMFELSTFMESVACTNSLTAAAMNCWTLKAPVDFATERRSQEKSFAEFKFCFDAKIHFKLS